MGDVLAWQYSSALEIPPDIAARTPSTKPEGITRTRRNTTMRSTITVSAATGDGVDRLAKVVAERLSGGFVTAEIETPSGNGRLFAWLSQHAEELDRSYTDESAGRVRITCRMPKLFANTIDEPDTSIRYLQEAVGARM